MVRWVMVAALCCIGTAACAEVRLVRDSGAVSGCQRLGEIHGSSLVGGALGGVGYDNAMGEMREKTAAAGGNHLLLIDMQSGMMGAKGIGEAYRCEERNGAEQSKPVRKSPR